MPCVLHNMYKLDDILMEDKVFIFILSQLSILRKFPLQSEREDLRPRTSYLWLSFLSYLSHDLVLYFWTVPHVAAGSFSLGT